MVRWELAWRNYADRKSIDPSNSKATFILGYNEPYASTAEAFSELKINLAGLGFSLRPAAVAEPAHDSQVYRASTGSEEFLIQEGLSCVVIRSLKSSIEQQLWGMIAEGINHDFLGELYHGISKKQVGETGDFSITTITGAGKVQDNEIETELLPLTLYLLKQKT